MGLFGDIELRTIGVTGGIGSGKTLFLLSIDPAAKIGSGGRPDTPADTLILDDEASSETYVNVRHFERISVHDDPRFAGKEPAAVWEALIAFFSGLTRKYKVVGFDTIQYLEECLEAYTMENPRDGATRNQYAKMKGIMFMHMQMHLRDFLYRYVRPKCEVCAWTAHQRSVWQNEKPTKKTRPYGKRTWMETAQLYIELNRDIEPNKTNPPVLPRAKVLKARLMLPGDQPILPPEFKDCTPDRIREYIAKPADWKHLKKDEVAGPEIELTEEEKLMIHAEIAENQKAAAQAQVELETMKAEAAAAVRSRMSPIERAKVASAPAEKAAQPEAEDSHSPAAETITADQAAAMLELVMKINKAEEGYLNKFKGALKSRTRNGSDNPVEMRAEVYSQTMEALKNKLNAVSGAG